MARFRIVRRPDPAHIGGLVVYEVEQCCPTFLPWTNIVIATYWRHIASFANINDAEACVGRILEIEAAGYYVIREYN